MVKRKPPVLLSNEYRTCSLSIRAVEREAFGGNTSLGRRAFIPGNDDDDGRYSISTGYVVNAFGADPLDILCELEEPYGTITDEDLESIHNPR